MRIINYRIIKDNDKVVATHWNAKALEQKLEELKKQFPNSTFVIGYKWMSF